MYFLISKKTEDYHSGKGEIKQKRTLNWMKKKGMKGAPGLDAYKARQKEHEDSRGKKMRKEEVIDEIAMKNPEKDKNVPLGRKSNPYGKGAIVKMIGSSIKDRVKQKARALTTTHKEGTSYGLYKGDGKPKGAMAAFAKKKKEKESTVKEAKVDMKLPDYKRATARDKRYGNPHGSLEVGAGIRRDRRADHEERRGKKTKVKESTKYYSGQDRNPNTGFPKGLKKSGKVTKEKPLTGVDYTNLQASYEPRFSVFDEAADRKMARATDQQLADAHKKYSGMDQSSPANAHMTKRITREMNRRKKAAKKKVDEAVGVSSEVSMSRARKEAELQRKEAQLKNKKMRKEHHQKDSNGKVIEHGDGSPSSLDELNRYEKETGMSSGSMNMPKGKPTQKGGDKNPVMRAVRTNVRKETGKPQGQTKTRMKGEKTADMKGPSAKLSRGISNLKSKRELDAKAKKAGYKSTQDYVNVQAVRKGGLGT